MGEGKFKVGIDFSNVLRTLSKQIYETPLAFVRENVQNAVDAIRIQALRDDRDVSDDAYGVDVTVTDNSITVRDNGIGMTQEELETFFWSMGASGKGTEEAKEAGCVGMFGIGGFANFGVCDSLQVASQTQGSLQGTSTRLSQSDIDAAGMATPDVTYESSNAAAPRGTIIIGALRERPAIAELQDYLSGFVRFVPIKVLFNGTLISQRRLADIEDNGGYAAVGGGEWSDGVVSLHAKVYETPGHVLIATVDNLQVDGELVGLSGVIRFENGLVDVFKRGFKLCSTQIPSSVGIAGRLDSDRFMPTAGRDSLALATTALLTRIGALLEARIVGLILADGDRLAQHTRIFRYVLQHGLVGQVGLAKVQQPDGAETTLQDVRKWFANGYGRVFFGTQKKKELNRVLQSGGHKVVLLSSDAQRQAVERQYLSQFCGAKPFDGIVTCLERYVDLTRFEKIFLSEVEQNIISFYELHDVTIVAGRLTEDIPVFVRERGSQPAEVFVDVRHSQVTKLEGIEYGSVLTSLISAFCREYLGQALRHMSPKFFGDGALNLELLAKRRSELWVLLPDDIGLVRRRETLTAADVHIVSGGQQSAPVERKRPPRVLDIVGGEESVDVSGYYLRLPDSAFLAYGDLLLECPNRGVVWAGNRILYVTSDTVSAAFHYEITVDVVIVTEVGGARRTEGSAILERPIQEMFGGLYFPIPRSLEVFLVPTSSSEIRLELHCDCMDLRTSRHWVAKGLDDA